MMSAMLAAIPVLIAISAVPMIFMPFMSTMTPFIVAPLALRLPDWGLSDRLVLPRTADGRTGSATDSRAQYCTVFTAHALPDRSTRSAPQHPA